MPLEETTPVVEKTPAQKWAEIVERSNGRLVFFPETMQAKLKEWNEKFEAFNATLNAVAKEEIKGQVLVNNLFEDLREFLEANGRPDIYRKEMSLNEDARKDGFFITTIDDRR